MDEAKGKGDSTLRGAQRADLLLCVLFIGWALALALRVAVFREGGEVGAYACTGLFAVTTLGLLYISAKHLIFHRPDPSRQYLLALGAVLTFLYRVVVPDGPLAVTASLVFAICTVSLLFVWVRGGWNHRGQRPPTSVTR